MEVRREIPLAHIAKGTSCEEFAPRGPILGRLGPVRIRTGRPCREAICDGPIVTFRRHEFETLRGLTRRIARTSARSRLPAIRP